jgi:exopolyphosphatase/pppGpp-phosphohydrolase
VFDLGSTSFQLLVTDAEADGTLTHVLRDRVILNLGAEVAAAIGWLAARAETEREVGREAWRASWRALARPKARFG